MISCSSSKQIIVNLTIDHIILGLVYQYIVIHVIKHLPSVTIKFLRLICDLLAGYSTNANERLTSFLANHGRTLLLKYGQFKSPLSNDHS